MILISGGARGIGAAQARLFAARGALVVIGDVLHDEGEALARSLGATASFVPLDVTREPDWAAAIAAAQARFGPPAALINNAGILRLGAVDRLSVDDFRLVMETNVVGALHGIRAVVPGMRDRGGGAIVNIGSAASTTGYANLAAYVSAKHALLGLTRAAALDLAPFNIRVNAVLPGQVRTPMTQGWKETPRLTPMGRAGEPEEIARTVAFLVSDDSSYTTGAAWVVDGGLTSGLSDALPRSR